MKNKTRFVKNIAAGLLLSLLGSCASPPPPRPAGIKHGDYTYAIQYATWLIQQKMKKWDAVGVGMALVDDQKTVWMQGFGHADKEKGAKVGPRTLFGIGSLSKLFTGVAIMKLAEEGKIDLDKPVQTYVPEFSMKTRFPEAGPITIRHLLTHHSGLPGDRNQERVFLKKPADFETSFMKLPELLKDEYVTQPPGKSFSYSNLGYGVLGIVIARVSGKSYARYLEDDIMKPLGMKDSCVILTEARSAQRSRPYYPGGKPFPDVLLRELPAGGINSSPADLAEFMKMFLAEGRAGGRQFLKPETVRAMMRPQNADNALDLGFRIGITIWFFDLNGQTMMGHGGNIGAYTTMFAFLPEHKLGAVIQINTVHPGFQVSSVAYETLRLALEAKTGQHVPRKKASPQQLSDETMKKMAGVYPSLMGALKIEQDGKDLFFTMIGNKLLLVPRTDGFMTLHVKLLGLTLNLDALNSIRLKYNEVNGQSYISMYMSGALFGFGSKVQPVPIGEEWKKRSGEYELVNPDEVNMYRKLSLRFDEKDGFLYADILYFEGSEMVISLPVRPASSEELITMGTGRGMGETMRLVREGGRELILFSGYKFERKR